MNSIDRIKENGNGTKNFYESLDELADRIWRLSMTNIDIFADIAGMKASLESYPSTSMIDPMIHGGD